MIDPRHHKIFRNKLKENNIPKLFTFLHDHEAIFQELHEQKD